MSESNPPPFPHDSFRHSKAHDRRTFLRRSLGVGAVAVAAAAGAVYLEDRHRHHDHDLDDHDRFPVDHDHRSRDGGVVVETRCVVDADRWSCPSNPRYGIDRLLYNSKFVSLHPRAIAYCATPDDVARCVEFATTHDVAIAARSGGHSYGGYSNSDGLVIDVSRMAGISVDTPANTARVGAGAKLIDVYNVIGNAGRLLPGGSCPTRRHRRAGPRRRHRRLRSQVRTHDRQHPFGDDRHRRRSNRHRRRGAPTAICCGRVRAAAAETSVSSTSFEFAVHPMPEVTLLHPAVPVGRRVDMLSAWGQWIDAAPDELWSNCQLLSQGTYGYLPQIAGVYCGSPSELASVLAPLKSMIATAPTYFVHRLQQLPERHGDRSGLLGPLDRGVSSHDAEPGWSPRVARPTPPSRATWRRR